MLCFPIKNSLMKRISPEKNSGWWEKETGNIKCSSSCLEKLNPDSSCLEKSEQGNHKSSPQMARFHYKTKNEEFIKGYRKINETNENLEGFKIRNIDGESDTCTTDHDLNSESFENELNNSKESRISGYFGFSYTPEELVKAEEYRIFSPPIQFALIYSSMSKQKKLNELINPERIGANYLKQLLCPNIRDIKISDFSDSATINSETISEISRENSLEQIGKIEFDGLKTSYQDEIHEESDYDRLTKLDEPLEWDSSGNIKDCEQIFQLGSRIRKLRNVNRDIHRDIKSLKRDLQIDDWKVSSLLEKANKFRKELQELKYLDDLLHLLRGGLNNVSRDNWPFIKGHFKTHDEINLII